MRKPNYNLERKDRERAKQAKAAAKSEKRAAKVAVADEATASAVREDTSSARVDIAKPAR